MGLDEVVEDKPVARPLQCDWQSCTKKFKRKSELQRHYRVHTNERPYACHVPGCGKTFTQQSALTVHNRTHTGEKPHQCQHIGCGKRFSDSSTRARHRKIHTGKRRYECDHDGCSKRLRNKATLENHRREAHQKGMTSNDIDNCSPDSHDDGPPATPQHSSMTSSPHELAFIDQGALDECLNWLPCPTDLPFQFQVHDMPQHHGNRQAFPPDIPLECYGTPMEHLYSAAETAMLIPSSLSNLSCYPMIPEGSYAHQIWKPAGIHDSRNLPSNDPILTTHSI